MYRLVFKCQRSGKLDYLYLTPIVNEENTLLSFGITYNKYKSYSFNTIYEAKAVLDYILRNKRKLLNRIKSTDKYIENIIGYEIEEDFGTQHIVRLVKVGKIA